MVWRSRSNFIQESNLRQRVLGNTNPVKLGRCFSFLNNWYGFEKGNNQHSLSKVFTSSDIFTPKNQSELAESYGITKQTMNNYMRMADMIPELEDLVDTGIVTKDTALAMIRNLSSNQSQQFSYFKLITLTLDTLNGTIVLINRKIGKVGESL